MRPALQDPFHQPARGRSCLLRPVDEPRRRPLGVGAMRARHVLALGRWLVVVAPTVGIESLALVEDLDRCGGVASLPLLPHEVVRGAVGMPLDPDVVVDVYAAPRPLRNLLAGDGPRAVRQPPPA